MVENTGAWKVLTVVSIHHQTMFLYICLCVVGFPACMLGIKDFFQHCLEVGCEPGETECCRAFVLFASLWQIARAGLTPAGGRMC